MLTDHSDDLYKLSIEHGEKLDSTTEYVDPGMSFQMASKSVQVAHAHGQISNFNSISEGMALQFIHKCLHIFGKISLASHVTRSVGVTVLPSMAHQTRVALTLVFACGAVRGMVIKMHGMDIQIDESQCGQ